MGKSGIKGLVILFLFICLSQTQSIQGKYKIVQINSAPSRSSSTVTLSPAQISIQACNTFWGPYTYNPKSRSFSISKNLASTRKGCQGTQDDKIIRAFKNSVTAVRQSQFLIFKNRNSLELKLQSLNGPRASDAQNDEFFEADSVQGQQQEGVIENFDNGQAYESEGAFDEGAENLEEGENPENIESAEQPLSQQYANEKDQDQELPLPQLLSEQEEQDNSDREGPEDGKYDDDTIQIDLNGPEFD